MDKALEAKENKMTDEELEAIGAGDQGMMFGYATNETEEYMPYPIYMAHKLARLDAVVFSTQHDENITQEQIHKDIKRFVFDPILPASMIDENTKFFINPTGPLVIGGPHGDSGLTGRKIIVDTSILGTNTSKLPFIPKTGLN